MPLTLVLGPANSARAGEVLGAYTAAARRDALLVVPTAADAIHYDRELAGSGVTLGRALTFDGLLGEIALRAGYSEIRLSQLRRELLIHRAVARLELEQLAPSSTTPGFAAALARLLATLGAARINPGRLARALHDWRDDAYSRDLTAIYRAYTRDLERAGAQDAEAHAWGTLDALRAAPGLWRGTPVFFYGFDDLTRIELDTVQTLAGPVGAAITVSLTYEPGHRALAARAGVVEALRGQAVRVRQLPPQDTFYASAELHHLERHLFEPDAPVMAATGAVMLLEAGGERAEAELVAAGVLEALSAGVPPDEIVVLTRSLRRSGALLEAALARYGVISSSARRVPFTHTALGRGVRAALTGDALTFLKLTADPMEVDELEAAARRQGAEVTAELPGLTAAVKALLPAAAGRTLTPAEALDVRAAAALERALAEVGQLSPTETRELIERLEVPASAAEGVLVAEPLSIRARRFDRVFITGLCEGEFPASDPPDPFLGDEARRELALSSGLVLEPEADPADRERYLLYACVSRARERIIFSYRTSDEEGNQVAPSPFLDDITALFSDLPRRRRLLADVVWAPEQAPTVREYGMAMARARADLPGAVRDDETAARNETRTLSASALAHVRHVQRISPSAIELFANCPVAWLVDRQLDPGDLEPEGDALVKGNFMHEVLRRVKETGPGLLDELTVPVGLAPGSPSAVRSAVLSGIVAELRRYLDWESAHPTPGFTPTLLEHPYEVELQDGLRVSGAIDRVDVDGRGRAIVWDYKSGRNRPERAAANWVVKHTFQAALYMLAAERLLGLEPVAGLYQPLAGDLRPRGAALAEVPTASPRTDVLEPEALAELLTEVETEVNRLAAILRRGELTPCPETCSPDGCRHPGICWAGR